MINLKKVIEKIKSLDSAHKVKFISLFGSRASETARQNSDYDLAVYYQGTTEERFRFRIRLSGELGEKIDLHIFQDLPLPVQKEVLGGKVIYYQNFQFVFDVFMRVIKDYNYFEKYLEEYYLALEGEAVGV